MLIGGEIVPDHSVGLSVFANVVVVKGNRGDQDQEYMEIHITSIVDGRNGVFDFHDAR